MTRKNILATDCNCPSRFFGWPCTASHFHQSLSKNPYGFYVSTFLTLYVQNGPSNLILGFFFHLWGFVTHIHLIKMVNMPNVWGDKGKCKYQKRAASPIPAQVPKSCIHSNRNEQHEKNILATDCNCPSRFFGWPCAASHFHQSLSKNPYGFYVSTFLTLYVQNRPSNLILGFFFHLWGFVTHIHLIKMVNMPNVSTK